MHEVWSRLYEIKMETPLGQRNGNLYVCREKEKLHGYLTILQHTEPYEGVIDRNGDSHLFGRIVTLMRTISYVATGKISDDDVALELAAECENYKETFTITGRLSREKGDQQ